MASYWTVRRKIKANVREHLHHITGGTDLSREDDADMGDHYFALTETFDTSADMVDPCIESTVSLPWPNNREHCERQLADNSTSEGLSHLCSISHDFEMPVDQTSSTDTDTESDVDEKESKLSGRLSEWASKFHISHTATSDLLEILQDYHPNLPRDPRTLLHTARNYVVRDIPGGCYHHFGMKSSILEVLTRLDLTEPHYADLNIISVQINIDGLPLFKSSSVQFWPILGRICNPIESEPFIIGLFCGNKKPTSITEFLQEFVDEMQLLDTDGFFVEGFDNKLHVKISCFICDAPAKAFIKQIKGHSGYYGCDRCIQTGVWNSKMTFPLVHSPLRTDAQFDEMIHEDHHTGESPLSRLSIGMVSQFPLDFMHLVCLGVMKRLIWLWTKGPIANRSRIGSNSVQMISSCLVAFAQYLPKEFPRKCRALDEVERWKATEFRQFLLYSGPVALKGILCDERYANFLLLFVGIYCLSSQVYSTTHCQYAHELLCFFVQEFGNLYGRDMLVYNVHGLVHLAEDVRKFGPLESFSAFPFESFLGRLKKKIRKPTNPVQQIIRRLSEERCNLSPASSPVWRSLVRPKKEHTEGPLPIAFQYYKQFREVCYHNLLLATSKGNNCVRVGNMYGLIRNILLSNTGNEYLLLMETFSEVSQFFTSPLNSSDLGIYLVSGLSNALQPVQLSEVACKYVILPYRENFVIIPLLHQFI